MLIYTLRDISLIYVHKWSTMYLVHQGQCLERSGADSRACMVDRESAHMGAIYIYSKCIYSLIYDTSIERVRACARSRRRPANKQRRRPGVAMSAWWGKRLTRATRRYIAAGVTENFAPESATVASTKRLQRDNEVPLNSTDRSVPERNFNFDRWEK